MSLLLSLDDILKETDYYKILAVSDNSSFDDISSSYKRLAKLYHPDKLTQSEKETGSAVFTKITSAYNALKDTDKRNAYDYEKRLKQEYEKTMALSKKNFSPNDNIVEKSTAKPTGFKLSSAINYTKVYNYDDHVSPSKPETNTIKSETSQKSADTIKVSDTINTKSSEQAEKIYNDALAKYKSGNIDEAILDLQTATVLRKSAKYYSALGLFMREKGWHGYAQVEFKKALAIDPKDGLANKYMDEYEQKKDEIRQNAIKVQQKSDPKNLFKTIIDFIVNFFSKK